MSSETVTIGMDLGTFKTSVVSSNGRREDVYSAVGWPKDRVARTMLGKDILFGKDVIEHRLSLDVIRPFEKGALKFTSASALNLSAEQVERHQQAAKLLVTHAVMLTRPPKGATIYGVIGAPARASIQSKQFLIEAAEEVFEAVTIVSEPFAVAFGMNSLNNTLIVDIGAGTIDLCPMFGRYPTDEDQVTIPIGGDIIDEQFLHRIGEMYPNAYLSQNMAREIKERYGFVSDVTEPALVTLPTDGKPTEFDLTNPLKAACRSIVPPLIEKLREVIAKVDPEFRQAMLDNIVLSGGGSQLKGLDQVIEKALQELGGGKVRKVGDSVFTGAVGAHRLALGMSPADWNKIRRLDRGTPLTGETTVVVGQNPAPVRQGTAAA